MVYVGGRFEVQREDVLERRFTCARCAFACRVEILARGSGTGRSPYFLENAAAARRAGDDAVYATGADADRVVALARCPRCHRRNRTAWASFATWTALKLVGFAALIAVPLTLVRAAPATVALVTGGAVAAFYLFAIHATWWRIDRRMRVARDPAGGVAAKVRSGPRHA